MAGIRFQAEAGFLLRHHVQASSYLVLQGADMEVPLRFPHARADEI